MVRRKHPVPEPVQRPRQRHGRIRRPARMDKHRYPGHRHPHRAHPLAPVPRVHRHPAALPRRHPCAGTARRRQEKRTRKPFARPITGSDTSHRNRQTRLPRRLGAPAENRAAGQRPLRSRTARRKIHPQNRLVHRRQPRRRTGGSLRRLDELAPARPVLALQIAPARTAPQYPRTREPALENRRHHTANRQPAHHRTRRRDPEHRRRHPLAPPAASLHPRHPAARPKRARLSHPRHRGRHPGKFRQTHPDRNDTITP